MARVARLNEEERIVRATVARMPQQLMSEIAIVERQLEALTADKPDLITGVGGSGLVTAFPPSRPVMCSSTLDQLGSDAEDYAAGCALHLYSMLGQKRELLRKYIILANVVTRVPQGARLRKLKGGGTWWARLGGGLLAGIVLPDAWLHKAVLGLSLPVGADVPAVPADALRADTLGLGDDAALGEDAETAGLDGREEAGRSDVDESEVGTAGDTAQEVDADGGEWPAELDIGDGDDDAPVVASDMKVEE